MKMVLISNRIAHSVFHTFFHIHTLKYNVFNCPGSKNGILDLFPEKVFLMLDKGYSISPYKHIFRHTFTQN